MVMMEFYFNVNELFPQTITRTVGAKLPPCRQLTADGVRERMAAVVNEMGLASAKAQGLRAPITSYQKLQATSNQTLYIMKEESSNNGKGVVVGILKTGQKNLFLNDPCGVQHEVSPLCVLDFYVHESKQRCGYGKALFEAMLKAENLKPFEIAIDRPSPKFLGFLRKHYKLQSYVRQANNYVVFDQFFTTCTDISHKSRRSLQHKHEFMHSSPSNTTKSPPSNFFSPQNSSSQRTTKSTAEAGAVKDTPNSNTLSPKETVATGSPKGALNSSDSADCSKSPHGVHVASGDLTSSLQGGIIKHHPAHQTKRQRFNIITGHPLQQESGPVHESKPSFTTSLNTDSLNLNNSIASTANVEASSTTCITSEQLQKAPHLDMRQTGRSRFQKNSSFSGLSTYRASFKPVPGFYSSSMGSSVPNVMNTSTMMNYSRHSMPHSVKMSKHASQSSSSAVSTGSNSSLLGSQWTSSTSRNMSASKLKGKWKTFIL